MNKIQAIKKILEQSGLHVRDISGDFITMEDPGCITRGFQDFLSDAWVVLIVITGFMIMMWGIAKIRGAKLSEFGHFKTLIMIFGVLSVLGPILNLVYGGDIMGMGCKEVKVSLPEVQKLLAEKMKSNPDALQYEDIDIYDSGPVYRDVATEPTPPDVDFLVKEPPAEEPVEEFISVTADHALNIEPRQIPRSDHAE